MGKKSIFGLFAWFAIGITATATPKPFSLNPTYFPNVMPMRHLWNDLPIFTKRVKPDYPKPGFDAKIQGYVILQATFHKDGTISNIEVVRRLGKGEMGFEQEAIAALKQWKFKPGKIDGVPSDIRMVIKIDFKLNE